MLPSTEGWVAHIIPAGFSQASLTPCPAPPPLRESLTAHPWSTPPGAWEPLWPDSPTPHRHQPGPAPPEQPQLPARREGLRVGREVSGGDASAIHPADHRMVPWPVHPPPGELPRHCWMNLFPRFVTGLYCSWVAPHVMANLVNWVRVRITMEINLPLCL